jgi:large subunit ribosomal protein L29
MRIDEIRPLESGELAKRLEEAQQELFNLRFRLATKQLVNYQEVRRTRRKIARMKTVLRERELEGVTHGKEA